MWWGGGPQGSPWEALSPVGLLTLVAPGGGGPVSLSTREDVPISWESAEKPSSVHGDATVPKGLAPTRVLGGGSPGGSEGGGEGSRVPPDLNLFALRCGPWVRCLLPARRALGMPRPAVLRAGRMEALPAERLELPGKGESEPPGRSGGGHSRLEALGCVSAEEPMLGLRKVPNKTDKAHTLA